MVGQWNCSQSLVDQCSFYMVSETELRVSGTVVCH